MERVSQPATANHRMQRKARESFIAWLYAGGARRVASGFWARAGANVVKQILLRVSGKWAEVRLAEMMEPLELDVAAGKIEFAQRFHHPDIDRERGRKPVGKEQDAIGDFAPHSGAVKQSGARLEKRQMVKTAQVQFATRNQLRRAKNVRRPETHFAGAQFGFGHCGQTLSRGKGPDRRAPRRNVERLAETLAEQPDDLLDLDDLLIGRTE